VAFQVQRALATGNLKTAEGKDAVIDELRPVFKELAAGALHDELLGKVADATDLRPSVVAERLAAPARGRARPAPERPAAEPSATAVRRPAPLPSGSRARMERSLLTEVVARPGEGKEVLASLDLDWTFTFDLHRRAAKHILANPAEPSAGIDPDDVDLEALIAGLIMRAPSHAASSASLDAELAKLRLADIERLITESRARGGDDLSELAAERVAVQAEVDAAITRAMEEAPAASGE
jgi:DNA primase